MSTNVTYLGREIDYLEDLGAKLRNLRGYATLAHELLQNADDAPGVRNCRFNICDEALIVENDGRFSDCGVLEEGECPWVADPQIGHRCDFHRFRKVAGGDKRREGDTTGAFGIGFISVYQITDRPELISGRHWILDECAEAHRRIAVCGGCAVCLSANGDTRFLLPWARDPGSQMRKSLRAQAVKTDVVSEILAELEVCLPPAMIFLKKLEKVEILHDGKLVRCIERIVEGDRILIGGVAGGEDQIWHVFRGSFHGAAEVLREEHGTLIEAKRKPAVSIAFKQQGMVDGLLCATLPTQQRTGLPFHINGDFFPSEDRKRVILDNDYQSDWNREIIRCAARLLSDSLENIRDRCDAKALWGLISAVKSAGQNPDDAVFADFWIALKTKFQNAEIVLTSKGMWRVPSGVRFLQQDEDETVVPILESAGIEIVHSDLREFQNLLISGEVGVPSLTFDSLVTGLSNAGLTTDFPKGDWPEFLKKHEALDKIWGLIDRILGKRAESKAFKESDSRMKAAALALSVRWDGSLCRCSTVFAPVDDDTVRLFHTFNPEIAFAAKQTSQFESIGFFSPSFGPEEAICSLEAVTPKSCRQVLEGKKVDTQTLVGWFETFQTTFREKPDLCKRLASLPLFPSGGTFRPLKELSLPGDFDDPLKMADVLDQEALPRYHDFLCDLGIERLSLRVFVLRHLIPGLKGKDLSKNQRRAAVLFLARRRSEISEVEEIQKALAGTTLVECMDGVFRSPRECYLPDASVSDILGSSAPIAFLPVGHEAIYRELLTWLGVADEPRVVDLLARVRAIVTEPPTANGIAIIGKVFGCIGQKVSIAPKTGAHGHDILKTIAWLPAEGDYAKWYVPSELHAVFQRYLFASQARFLGMPMAVQQQSTLFLEFLEIATKPTTKQVVAHLLHCAETAIPVSSEVYRHLNDNFEDAAIFRLRDKPCLRMPGGEYVSPDRVFWGSHPFGRFRWQLGSELRSYGSLFEKLGVKDVPSHQDAFAVLAQLDAEFDPEIPLNQEARHVNFACWSMLESAIQGELIVADDLLRLRDLRRIPNAGGFLSPPRSLFFEDRAGLAEKFDGELSMAIIRRPSGAATAMAAAGVQPLANAVTPHIVECEDPVNAEEIAQLVRERRHSLVRVAESSGNELDVTAILASLDNVSFTKSKRLSICYTVRAFSRNFTSNTEGCPAHYLKEDCRIYFMERDGRTPWVPLARELARLMGAEDEPSRLATAIKEVLVASSAAEATKVLDEFGFRTLPEFHQTVLSAQTVVDTLGETVSEGSIEFPETGQQIPLETENQSIPETDEKPTPELDIPDPPTGDTPPKTNGTSQTNQKQQHNPLMGAPSSGSNGAGKEKKRRKSQGGRLRSYVLPENEDDPDDAEPDSDAAKQRSEVELAGINMVVEDEKRLGCVPEVMPPLNEGFDIISRDPDGNILRYIEVKSISGEWGDMGVGLTSAEFAMAQLKKEQYWLYVVENALGEEPQIHRIQDPANKVDRFQFDDGWQGVAEQDERKLYPPEGY